MSLGENGIKLCFLPPTFVSHWVSFPSLPVVLMEGTQWSLLGTSLIPWLVLMMGLVFGSILSLCLCALQALKTRVSNLPTVKKFLQPGSPRKPPLDEKSLEQAKKIFRIK